MSAPWAGPPEARGPRARPEAELHEGAWARRRAVGLQAARGPPRHPCPRQAAGWEGTCVEVVPSEPAQGHMARCCMPGRHSDLVLLSCPSSHTESKPTPNYRKELVLSQPSPDQLDYKELQEKEHRDAPKPQVYDPEQLRAHRAGVGERRVRCRAPEAGRPPGLHQRQAHSAAGGSLASTGIGHLLTTLIGSSFLPVWGLRSQALSQQRLP